MHEKPPVQPSAVLSEKSFVVDDRKFTAQIRRLDFDSGTHELVFRYETDEPDLHVLTEVSSTLWRNRESWTRKGLVEMLCQRGGYMIDGLVGFSFWTEGDEWQPGFVYLNDLEEAKFVEEVFFVRFVLQSLETFAAMTDETLGDRQSADAIRTDASQVKEGVLKEWLNLWSKGKDEQLPPRYRAYHDEVLD